MLKTIQLSFQLFLIAVLGSIFLGNILRDSMSMAFLLIIVFLLGLQLYIYIPQKISYVLLLSFFLWAFGGSYYSSLHYTKISTKLEQSQKYLGLYNDFQAEVGDVYRRAEFYDEYFIEISKIEKERFADPIWGLVRFPKNFHLNVGEYISFSGKMYELEDFDGFAYKDFMLSRDIYFSLSSTNFERIWTSKKWIHYYMRHYREILLDRIWSLYPQEEAIFLGGILFWARENIPKELKEDFNNSWLTHFIAVSGFNITLCIIFVTALFGFLPIFPRIFLVVATIIAFSFFVGLWAPVVRAAIMGIIAYVLSQYGNKSHNFILLLFTALVMTLWSPFALNYNVSMHLSFLAVIWILYTQELWKKLCVFLPEIFSIREAFVLTLAALSFSLPVMIFQFWQVSLFAPIANIAVTWTIPLAMLVGALSLLSDVISPFLGQMVGFIAWILLYYDIQMVHFFWNLEFALIRFDFWAYKNIGQIVYFIILTYILFLYHSRKKKVS